MKSGIYMIFCIVNKKYYIGSSKCIAKRWYNHRLQLKKNTHCNKHLQRTWDLYGEGAFIFEVIEECDKSILINREVYWCTHFNAHIPEFGFNEILPGTYAPRKKDRSEYKNIPLLPVICIEVNTGIKIEYESRLLLSEKLSIDIKKIGKLIQYWREGASGKRSWNNYMFVDKRDYKEDFDYIGFNKPNPRNKIGGKKGWRKPNAKCRQVKEIKPIKDRNLKRCPIILKNISTGEEEQFASVKKASEDKCLNYTKLHKLISAEFEKYSHRGYYAKRA